MFHYASAFNHTWCKKTWANAPINKPDFTGSSGLAFCCFPGTFYDNSTQMMHKAYDQEAGIISTAAISFKCQQCPPGHITSNPNAATICNPCGKGKYQEESAQFECESCIGGKWSNVTSLHIESGCHNCTAGRYSKPNGADSIEACVGCQPGRKGDVAKTGADDEKFCTPCNAATYSDVSGETSCKVCNLGQYQPEQEKTVCLPCLPGTYGKPNRTGCIECAEGTASKEASRGTPCPTCPQGRETELPGATQCKECLAGQFKEPVNGGDHICSECSAGKYSEASNEDNCTTCEDGDYQTEEGKTACFPCLPGTHGESDHTGCIECAEGTASKEASRDTPCPTCAQGRGIDAKGAIECSACRAGKYEDEAGACSVCPEGWAQPNQKQPRCVQCGTKDSPNYASAGSILKGESTDERTGSASCSLCDLGKYGPTASPGTCVKCPIGTYEDGKGGLEDASTGAICKPCPIDTWSDQTGKSSNADCAACPEKTTTNNIDGRTQESDCVCQASFYQDPDSSELVCVTCPQDVAGLEDRSNCR